MLFIQFGVIDILQPLSVELGPGILGNIFDGIQVSSCASEKFTAIIHTCKMFDVDGQDKHLVCMLISIAIAHEMDVFS
jgi:hypothetical protein